MKPILFAPNSRPKGELKALGDAQGSFPLTLVEVSPTKLVVKCEKSPYLRGVLYLNDQHVKVNLLEAQERENFYSFEVIDGQEFYVSVLKSLGPEALTRWLIDLPEIKNQQKQMKNKEDLLPPETKDITLYLENFFLFFYKKPWLSIAILFLATLFPAYHLRNLKVDPSLNRALVQGSKHMKLYDASLELFGSDKTAILYFKDPHIFTKEKLELLQNLTWEIQKNPQVARVRSIFTTTFMRYQKNDDTLYTEPLFTNLDISQDEMKYKLSKVQADPNLHGRLIDVPKNTVVIVLELEPEVSALVVIAEYLKPKITALAGQFEQAFQSGEPTLELFQKEEMTWTPKIFLPLIALVLLLSFVYFLGSMAAFIITIIATSVSILWAFGVMTWLGIPIQAMVNIVPGVILTLAATEIVHIASSLKEAANRGLCAEDSLRFLSRDIGKALFLTFSTTAIGFLSVRLSEIQMLQEFAVVSTLGLVFAFIITLLYIPIHIRFFGHKVREKSSNQFFNRPKRYFKTLYVNLLFSKRSLTVVILFVLVNSYFATKVIVDNDTFSMIANRAQVKKDLLTYKNEMGGMKSIHTVLKFKDKYRQEGAKFSDAQHLNKLWQLHQKLQSFPEIEHVDSFPSLMALLNREMREGNQDFYKTPNVQPLIDQYFIMLSRDDVDPLLTSDKQMANLKISHDLSSSKNTERFLNDLTTFLDKELKDTPYEYYVTSRNILNLHAANTLISSQVNSLLTMSVVIVFLISIFFRSLSVGLLSLVPNLFPVFGLFGIMGLFDIPLNVGTCIVATITIGVAADDTIHLFTRFFRDKELKINPLSTSVHTIHDEVIPILTTSLSLALSFSFFSFARFTPMIYFGLLSAYVLILAVISDLYLGPGLLSRFFLGKERSKSFLKWMLIDSTTYSQGGIFYELGPQEVTEVLELGKIKAASKELPLIENGVHNIPLNSSGTNIYLKLTSESLNHLSPRTFEKFCHNLKVLTL